MPTKFKDGYRGKKLMKHHNLKEYGVWVIKGEDSNPDYHGSHYMPTILYLEGPLDEVIEAAQLHPRFYTWGAGGTIEPIDIEKSAQAISRLSADNIKKKALNKLTKQERQVLGLEE